MELKDLKPGMVIVVLTPEWETDKETTWDYHVQWADEVSTGGHFRDGVTNHGAYGEVYEDVWLDIFVSVKEANEDDF